jgi:hypothetical protein
VTSAAKTADMASAAKTADMASTAKTARANAIVPVAVVAMPSTMAVAAAITCLRIFQTPDVSFDVDSLSGTAVLVLL